MTEAKPRPVAILAASADPRPVPPVDKVPEPFRPCLPGREKRPLGNVFGLKNFGVNQVKVAPGGVSALRHAHALQDEFVYVLEGTATLITDAGETLLSAGMCAGFPAGTGDAHRLVNRGDADLVYLEIGDRTPGDSVVYPDDDVMAESGPDGGWIYYRKDGTPY